MAVARRGASRARSHRSSAGSTASSDSAPTIPETRWPRSSISAAVNCAARSPQPQKHRSENGRSHHGSRYRRDRSTRADPWRTRLGPMSDDVPTEGERSEDDDSGDDHVGPVRRRMHERFLEEADHPITSRCSRCSRSPSGAVLVAPMLSEWQCGRTIAVILVGGSALIALERSGAHRARPTHEHRDRGLRRCAGRAQPDHRGLVRSPMWSTRSPRCCSRWSWWSRPSSSSGAC